MNMFARFDENPAMTLRVIKETKRYGRTDARTDNVKTVYPLQTKFAGGIKTVYPLQTKFAGGIISLNISCKSSAGRPAYGRPTEIIEPQHVISNNVAF